MQRLGAKLHAVGQLDDLPQIHDGDAVADMGDRRQIVADEQVTDTERLLQALELVHDLRPDRHVERRNRLVEHDQPSIGRERPRYGHTLALPAAEFVREKPRRLGLEPDQFQYLSHPGGQFLAGELGVDLPTVRR